MPINPVTLAQELIRCPSVTPTEGGALDLLESMLTPLGFRCMRQVFDAPGPEPVDNLYARWGTEGSNLCFAGHTDVVPPGDPVDWTHDPFAAVIDGDTLYGRGAEDMKSAVAAFVAAASRYIEAGGSGSISLLITADEEGPGVNGTKPMLAWLKKQGECLDACIVGEPTNPKIMGEMVKIGRRGSVCANLTVEGMQGHVAYPHLADNPVTHLVNILQELKAHTLDEGTEHFPPSNLEVTSIDVGNPSDNVIPARAGAKLNIRFNDLHTSESLMQWIESVCKRHAGDRGKIEFRVSGEAFLTPPGALSDIVVEAVEKVVGRTPELSTTGGTSDARFIRNYCPVVEFGTTGLTAHKVNECVKVSDIKMLADVYETMLRRYFSA